MWAMSWSWAVFLSLLETKGLGDSVWLGDLGDAWRDPDSLPAESAVLLRWLRGVLSRRQRG